MSGVSGIPGRDDPAAAIDRAMGRRRGDRIVGAGRATQRAIDQAMAASRSDRAVVIGGPAGSGRAHLARAIHQWSDRASAPFVVVTAGAVSEALLGREIFGCARSAHASPPEEYAGALARAGGGTLLIEGAERLAPALRQLLSRALRDGRFQREGDGAAIPLRARVLLSAEGAPSADWLAEVPHETIELLPLEQRREDVLPLAAHFLRLAAEEEGVAPVGFTGEARSALLTEPWPGNVAELSERVRQAVKLAGNGAVSAEALLLATDAENIPSFKDAKRAFETRYVVGLLRRCSGNISRAARLAKKDRKDFYDVIRRTGVDPSEYR